MQKLTIANESFEIPDLEKGSHLLEEKYCAMEMVAYLAGEEHSDQPECVCPVIAEFVRKCNDYMGFEARNKLLPPLLLDLIGTRSTEEIEQQRAFMLADWAVRNVAPIALHASGHDFTAFLLRKQPAIVDEDSASSAANAAWAAADAADAATADAAADAADATANAVYATNTVTAAMCAARAARAAGAASAVWDLVPEIIQKLISVGDRDSMDLTKVAGRARKLNLCKS